MPKEIIITHRGENRVSIFWLLVLVSILGVGCKSPTNDAGNAEAAKSFDEDDADNKEKAADSRNEATLDNETESKNDTNIENETDETDENNDAIEIDPGPSTSDPGTPSLTTGYGLIQDDTMTTAIGLQQGTEATIPIIKEIKCISQEGLISFIENNEQLFTSEDLEIIKNHKSYTERGLGADLFLGMLGVKFGEGFDYYNTEESIDISTRSEEESAFLEAIRQLEETRYEMAGIRTAVGLSMIPASPKYWAKVTRIDFPDGHRLKSVNTHVVVTDENDKQERIHGKPDEPPLDLFATEDIEGTVEVLREHSVVMETDTPIKDGEEAVLPIDVPVNAVSHRDIVNFIENNRDLFSDDQYNTIKQHDSYRDSSRAPSLLLGILGVKLGGSFDYFSNGYSFSNSKKFEISPYGGQMEISPLDKDDVRFIAALSSLKNRDLVLSGSHTAVGIFGVAATPYVYLDVAKIDLPDGTTFRTIDTNAVVADGFKNQSQVISKEAQPPLLLK